MGQGGREWPRSLDHSKIYCGLNTIELNKGGMRRLLPFSVADTGPKTFINAPYLLSPANIDSLAEA